MNARTQITLNREMQRRAHAKAADLGISFAEYVRRLVERDIGKPKGKVDVSVVFNLVKGGPITDIARDKDKMIGEALWNRYLRETEEARRRSPKRRAVS